MTLPKLSSTGDNEHEEPHQGKAAVYGGAAHFRSRAHKLATLFMMTTGSANAAMFPMMFIFYGGVPFLLAYLVLLATVAMPMMHLESNLAQFSGDGNCGIFSAVPLFLGTGYALTLYVVLRVVADSLPLSDVLLQMAGLGGSSVPWAGSCPGGWVTNNRSCYAIKQGSVPCRSLRGRFVDLYRRFALGEGLPLLHGDHVALVPSESYHDDAARCMPELYTPVPPYDFRRPQGLVEHTFDSIRVQPLLSMAAIWVLVFTLSHVGFIRLKNFFYVTLTLHIATTITLLLRALTLEGATRGLHAFAYAEWSHITNVEPPRVPVTVAILDRNTNPQMWFDALYTCLESVGVTGTVYLGVQRLNSFKNNFHEDVMFVLVADTASKGIGTFIAFLYLGHLSASMGVDVRVLIDYGSNFIVSVTPQALSLAPDPEFWSQVHLLWLLSTMVPKFLIVPDIIIEALSLPHPFILRHRTVAHFIICSLMFITSIVGCSTGGASVVSLLARNQDQSSRLLMVVLETVVILQFYGARRLAIDEHMMTNREPSVFVKICWTSVTPFIVAAVVWFKTTRTSWSSYPLWIASIIIWFMALEFSFILVFALTLLDCTKLKPRQSVAPLPVRVPVSWEHAMVYRQQIALEAVETRKVLEKERAPVAPSPTEAAPAAGGRRPSHNTKDSPTPAPSDSEHMASDLYVPSERTKQEEESPSDWRNFSFGDESAPAKKPKKKRSLRKATRETGTLHISRNLSSVRRLAKRDQRDPPKTTKGKPAAVIISKPRATPEEAKPPHSPDAVVPVGVEVLAPQPADNAVPTAAASPAIGDYEGGDSFEDLDIVAHSVPLPTLPAPAPSTDAEFMNPSAERLAIILKSFEEDHDNPVALHWYQSAAVPRLVCPRGPTRDLPVAKQPSAAAPAPVGATGAATSHLHRDTSGAPKSEKGVAAEDAVAAGRRKERQAASGPLDGHQSVKKKASRKRSASRSSSTSSRKLSSFASDGRSTAPGPRATMQASSSVASTKASTNVVAPAAATPGKSSRVKLRRMSRLSQASDMRSSDDHEAQWLNAKPTADHETSRRASSASGSAQPASHAGDIAPGVPSDNGVHTGQLKPAPPAQPEQPVVVPLARATASETARSPIRSTGEAEAHSGKEKPTSPVPAPSADTPKSATTCNTPLQANRLDDGIGTAAYQPETGEVSKQPSDKATRSLRKLAVGYKRRSRRQRRSRKSIDSNQDVDDTAALRATDISRVSAESAAALEPGSSRTSSLASMVGMATPQPVTYALNGTSRSSARQREMTTATRQPVPTVPPAPAAVIAPRSVSQTSARTTSRGTHRSSLSLAKECDRSTAAAIAGVEAKDVALGETVGIARAESPKELRDAPGNSNPETSRGSRGLSKKKLKMSRRDRSGVQNDHDSDGHH